MTRETKIGLLVGLAFIIVIGILLSDHFRGAMELPPAALDRAGPNVLSAVNTLGSGQAPPPVTLPPAEVSPRVPVPTPRDLEPKPTPVVLDNSDHSGGVVVPPHNVDPALLDAAHQHGQDLVASNLDGTPGVTTPQTETPPVARNQYTAQAGDSVSRMAARLLGANTKANRAAIIAANPDLQQNADRVIVGQTYVIPGMRVASPATSALATPATSAMTPSSPPADGGTVYTVQVGDNLWRIAANECGDSGAVAAIQELNSDVLAGGTTLRPGMKLRLPAKRLASAN